MFHVATVYAYNINTQEYNPEYIVVVTGGEVFFIFQVNLHPKTSE